MSYTELAEDLASAPDWVVARATREAGLQRSAAESAAEEVPVLAALRSVGVQVDSVFDVGAEVRGRVDVARVLVDDLQGRPYSDFKRGIVAQCVASTRVEEVWEDLAALYRRRPAEHEAVGLAVALAACGRRDRLDELIGMVRDASFGSSRVMLVADVSRRLGRRGDDLLLQLAGDPELHAEASAVLHRRQLARSGRARRAASLPE